MTTSYPGASKERPDRPCVLIIDDERDIASTIRLALERDYEVSIAYDGKTGLEMAQQNRPDLIILDMMMPRRSGLLVLESLRQSEDPPIPVIIITSNEGTRHREYAKMLGVDVYLQKPFQMDELVGYVERLTGAESN